MKKNAVLPLALAGIASLTLASTASAHDIPDRYGYLGGHVSQYWFEKNEMGPNGYDEVTLPGLQAGLRFHPNWSFQAWWERNQAHTRQTGDKSYISNLLGSVRYHFNDTSVLGFEPYAGIAAGQLRFDHGRGAKDDTETVAGFEFGAQARIARHFILDVGARPVWTEWNDRIEGEIYAGLNIVFGATSKPVAPVEPAVLDDDNDGVPNELDQCPNTPAGVAVDEKGCPLDSDGDGVPDYLDRCPDTPAGALVDEHGCQQYLEQDIRETLYVEFELDKAEIRQEFIGELNTLADWMKKYPNAQVTLEGHTDSTGRVAYNQTLSERRAESVKNTLVSSFNVDPSRITTSGRGPSQPIADNKTAEGRAQNRRVEVVIKATKREALFENN